MRRLLAGAGVLLAAVAVGGGPVIAPAVAAPISAAPGPSDAPEYWFNSWQIPALWNSGTQGQGVTIAEIDTGVNATLPELSGRVLSGTDLGSAGGDGLIDREVDAFGHGTAMASIMVARPGLLDITGIAPQAKILPIAIPLNGTTDADDPDELPEAIKYAADHHAKIISMSLGGKRFPNEDAVPCSDDEQDAIYYALRKGVLVVAAVGNSGPTKNTIEDPGVCLGVVSVGAVDESGTVASFSSRQPYLTLVAPGVNIPSLGRINGEAYSGDGTSQATAITSAVAALVWSRYPKLTAAQITARLLATLDQHRSTPSDEYGYGELDAYRAVTGSVPANAPNPVDSAAAPFIARESALAAAPHAPAPAARSAGATGAFQVGDRPGITAPPVLTGIALAAAGLLLLVVLLGSGVRGRRRRRRLAAPPGWMTFSAPTVELPPPTWTAPTWPAPQWRPPEPAAAPAAPPEPAAPSPPAPPPLPPAQSPPFQPLPPSPLLLPPPVGTPVDRTPPRPRPRPTSAELPAAELPAAEPPAAEPPSAQPTADRPSPGL